MVRCVTVLRFLAWLVNTSPAARPELATWNRTFQFTLSGEEPFYVGFIDGRMECRPGRSLASNVEFRSTSKDFLGVIVGKMKFERGFSSGSYKICGSMTDAVRLMRVVEIAYESHTIIANIARTALAILTWG